MDSAYPGSVYFFLYEANDDGTFVKDQSGLPLSLGSLENYSSAGVAVVLHTDTSDDRDALRVEYYSGTETCLLTFGFSNRMLSAQLSGYDDSGPMAKLIQDYKSYVPKQQWSFELTTDINTQFNRLDRNSDGELSLDEYGNVTDPVVLQSGDTITYLLNSFIIYDNNSDGFVTRDEQKAYMKKYYADHKDALMKLILEYIKDFDENNDSRLQSDELKLYLASSARVLTKDSFTASFTRYDKNGDKGLDGDELYDMRIGFSDETHHLIPMRVLPPFDKTSTLHY
uniref:EF-hand domain-containing protein n=1 Tax=Plectus sambesii TaxID=2011161 RepID=A0A914WB42_9BILA